MSHLETVKSSRSDLRRRLVIGASLGAMLSIGAPALAQDNAEDEVEEERRLGAVEVTATRREGVTVQDVPIAVTAYDAELLDQQNFQRLNDLEQIAPSVQITQGQSASAGTSISIRGIGTGADNFGFEPAVGIFVDGVFRTRTGSGIQELPELAGVEVLRGPQGTLFGRNTSAGVVSIRTAKPTFDYTGYAEATVGNFSQLEFGAGVSGPVSENLAFRLDGRWRQRDGIITDVNSGEDLNNIDRFLLRGQLLYESGDTDVRIIADYSQTDEICCAATIRDPGALGNVDLDGPGGFPPVNFFNLIAAEDGVVGVLDPEVSDVFFTGAFSPEPGFGDEVEDFGVSIEINHDFGPAKFTSISALRNFDSVRSQDIDFSGINSALRDGTTNEDLYFTQEFRLQGLAFDGRLDWLVGTFYLNEQIDTFDTVQLGNDFDQSTDAVAAFTFQGLDLNGDGVPDGIPPQQFFGTLGPAVPTFLFTDPAGNFVPFLALAGDPAIQGAAADLAIAALIAGGADPTSPDFPAMVAAAAAGQIGAAIGGAGFTPFTFTPTSSSPNPGGFDTFNQTTNAFSIFTHNELSITERLTLTAGLRYNFENKDINADVTGFVPACFERAAAAGSLTDQATALGAQAAAAGAAGDLATAAALGDAASTLGDLTALFVGVSALACNPAVDSTLNVLNGQSASRTDNQITGTAKLSYALTPDILLFGGYSRGFKSGGFNLARDSADSIFTGDGPQLDDLEFDEETVNSYEAGIKTSWYDGRVNLNATGFFLDVQDFQENVFNGTNFVVANSDVESYGVELDLLARPHEALTLQGGFTWNVAERAEDVVLGTGFLPGNTQLANTPEFVVTGAATLTIPVTESLVGIIHGNVRWNSSAVLTSLGNIPVGPEGALLDDLNNGSFALVGARVGVQTRDGKYSLSVFAENLFDEEFNFTAFQVPTLTATFAGFPGNPRFWAVEGRIRF